MLVIGTNMPAIRAANALSAAQKQVALSMQRLSTGKRINSAKDDPAGFAIADSMTAQIRGMTQAARNAGDGISLLQTTDSVLGEATNMMQRIRELAVQSATGTYSDDDRVAMQAEVAQLQGQLTQTLFHTQFNGQYLQTLSPMTPDATTVQTGANAGDSVAITSPALVFHTVSILTADSASAALQTMDDNLKAIGNQRARVGASMSRLDSVISNLTTGIANLTDARSRIEDTDYAAETMALAKAQILAQSSTAMLAQANQMNAQLIQMLLR